MFSKTSVFLGSILAAVAFSAPSASAASLTQTATFTPQTLLTNNSGATFGLALNGTFNQFDSTLGTLTGVTFSVSYPFQYSLVGDGGGSINCNGPFLANGAGVTVGGSLYGIPAGGTVYAGGAPASGTKTITTGGEIAPDNALTTGLSTYQGTGTFSLNFNGSISYAGGGQFSTPLASLSLLAPATESVTFTYSVPEPASISLLGVVGLALLRRRRDLA